MSWAAGVVTSAEKVGELQGDQIGAKRILNEAFHETLIALDDRGHSFAYQIEDGPGAVSKDAVKNYIGRARIFPITENDTTFIEWESTYDSTDDGAIGDLCNPIYHALLDALQKHFAG